MSEVASRYRLVRPEVAPVSGPTLDARQQAVVDHEHGPMLVLAGPGTGKTTTLVEAVIERVRRGASPEEVLVLTFSRKAADELRERIAVRLGRTVSEPAASTFHAWCYSLVRAHAPAGRSPRLLSQAERDVRIRELLRGHAEGFGTVSWPAAYRSALLTRGFARELSALFDRARERGLDGFALRALGDRTGRGSWVAAGEFLEEYLDVLDARGEIDYAQLVVTATQLLADEQIASGVRDRYAAVFVDEYQDTDPSQERLLQVVAGGGRDLVVVGDPDQSIYAFRGADVDGILRFRDRFPTSKGEPAGLVTLEVCRRSGPALVALSRSVAEKLPTPGLSVADRQAHRELVAAGPASAALEVRVHGSVADEVAGIADLLRRAHLEDGLAWSQMAVLMRSGMRSHAIIRRALVSAGVPVSATADDVPVARDPVVAPLLIALRLCGSSGGIAAMSVDDARVLLTSPLTRARPALLRTLGRRLRDQARAAGLPVPPPAWTIIRDALIDPTDLAAVDRSLVRPVLALHELLAAVSAELSDGATPDEGLWRLWHDSGWDRRLELAAAGNGAVARSADRDLDVVIALFEAAARLEEREPRAGVAALLEEIGMQEIPGGALEDRAGAAATVSLLTAHRAKGLEWDLVVVADLQDDVWPDLRRRTTLLEADLVDRDEVRAPMTAGATIADERRLFYVAVTRARRRLVLTAVTSASEAGDRPSRFIEDLVDELPTVRPTGTSLLSVGSLVAQLRSVAIDESATDSMRSAAAFRLAALASATDDDGVPLVAAASPDHWWGVEPWTTGSLPVRPVDLPLALSGSSVSSYEQCPLRWFLDREVQARSAPSASQGFGTVIHAIARLVADGVLPPDPDALVQRLDLVWDALGFEAAWQSERERGDARLALGRLAEWLSTRGATTVVSEREFEVTIGDVIVRGATDRLEVGADGRVWIVDFKTGGTAPSKADTEANPQLAVYQIAAREGGFSDVTGDAPVLGGAELVMLRVGTASGMPVSRMQPALPDERPDWADDLLTRTATGIRAESFPARTCTSCRVCNFRAVCPAQDAGAQVVK
jgi:superfamily I DNA/RNA helicase/RecB family exonuclease